jgi:polysaccharide export outer membrane protein
MVVTVKVVVLAIIAFGVFQGCSGVPKDVIEELGSPSYTSEFLLGPEDVLEVTVWRNPDLSRITVVRPDGMITLPLIGEVQASGLTAAQLTKQIEKRLKEFKQNPEVSVSVKEVNSYFIYVLGEVARPGKYPLKSYATVLQGISLAGGLTPFASKSKIKVIRVTSNGKDGLDHIHIPVPYDDLLSGEAEIRNFILRSGDTIVVP